MYNSFILTNIRKIHHYKNTLLSEERISVKEGVRIRLLSAIFYIGVYLVISFSYMKKYFFLFIINFFWGHCVWAQIVLDEKKPALELDSGLYFLEDKIGSLTIEQVSSDSFQAKFKPVRQKVFNAGVTSSVYWLRLDIKSTNLNIKDWLIYTSYSFLDELFLYQKNKDNGWSVEKSGIIHSFKERPIKHRYLIFPLAFKDTLTQRYFLRVSSQTPVQLPLHIERGTHFAEPSRTLELFYGIFVGVTGLMFLGSLFYWIYFREKEYLFYSVFLIGAISFYLSLSGHFFQYFWRENGEVGKIFLGFAMGIWVIGAGLFTKKFLQTFRYYPLGGTIMNIYAIIGVWISLSVFFLPYRIFSIQIIVLGNIGNFLIMLIGLICWRRGNPFAKYFAIAWIFYVTGTTLLALTVTGFLPRTFITAHLGEISCVFEVIMFALALSYKSRMKHEKVRQDRLRSQQKVIELQRDNNARLERQVAERTKALQSQQQEIETQNEELKQQREELEASRNQLAEQNRIIEQKNQELRRYNENLEALVSERTRQLTQANLELINQNTQLEQFAFITAHNLRSPVAQLMGLTGLFNTENLADPLNAEIIKHIITSTQAMHQTLQDLGEILDIRKGKEQNLEKLDFRLIAEEVIKNNFAKHQDAQIILRFDEASEVYFVKAYLKSIFYNFISNALKYKHPKRNAKIEISTKDFPEHVCLIFKDNGIGIDLEKYRHKLFGLYQRFNLEKEGKGMGLYLCKTQIETLGGYVEVQSQVGEGTQFSIYFKKLG